MCIPYWAKEGISCAKVVVPFNEVFENGVKLAGRSEGGVQSIQDPLNAKRSAGSVREGAWYDRTLTGVRPLFWNLDRQFRLADLGARRKGDFGESDTLEILEYLDFFSVCFAD